MALVAALLAIVYRLLSRASLGGRVHLRVAGRGFGSERVVQVLKIKV